MSVSCDNCGKTIVGHEAVDGDGLEVFCSLECNVEYYGDCDDEDVCDQCGSRYHSTWHCSEAFD